MGERTYRPSEAAIRAVRRRPGWTLLVGCGLAAWTWFDGAHAGAVIIALLTLAMLGYVTDQAGRAAQSLAGFSLWFEDQEVVWGDGDVVSRGQLQGVDRICVRYSGGWPSRLVLFRGNERVCTLEDYEEMPALLEELCRILPRAAVTRVSWWNLTG